MKAFLRRLKDDARAILPQSLFDSSEKHSAEMAYWKQMHFENQGVLRNAHYKYFYTEYFAIAPEEYADRAILDIGCGPRGSLEWADNAKERVGLDPLVNQYRSLGINAHRMSYVCAPSEKIPFPEQYFDFVFSFNSLDHVDNVEATLSSRIQHQKVTRVEALKTGMMLRLGNASQSSGTAVGMAFNLSNSRRTFCQASGSFFVANPFSVSA
jgi:SAM-dependent methyltransferase